MGTLLARTYVTHTPPVRHAIDVARQLWPDEKPGALLVRLIAEGGKSFEAQRDNQTERLMAARLSLAGRYTGAFGPGYLDEVRDGWPE